jgi:hypothetical protein
LSTPRKEGFDRWPESDMPQELGEDISLIDLSTDLKEPDYVRSNGFTNRMISQGIMAFVEERMRSGATGNQALVITKQVSLVPSRGTPIIRRV